MNAEEQIFPSGRKDGGFPAVYCIISKSKNNNENKYSRNFFSVILYLG